MLSNANANKEVLEIQIDRMSFGSAAVGRFLLPGAERPVVIFVEGAAPGETVRVQVEAKKKNYWEAKLLEVLKPSSERVTPPCPVFEKCGGCQWQFLDYSAQVKAKEQVLLHQIQKMARLSQDQTQPLLQVHPAENPYGYRSRLQVRGDKNGLGFFERGTHDIVHVDRCLVAHPDIQKTWTDFKNTKPLAQLGKVKGQFKVEWTRSPTGQVLEAINRDHAALGFSQVNAEQNQVLVSVVAQYAQKSAQKNVLFDLFGGQGNLSKGLEKQFQHTICVDSHNKGKPAPDVFQRLATGFSMVQSDVESFLKGFYWQDAGLQKIDCVIADPPRSGLEGAAAPICSLNAPMVILVSCDPSTFSRDLAVFLPHYELKALHLVDMFPQTYHMEIIAILHSRG